VMKVDGIRLGMFDKDTEDAVKEDVKNLICPYRLHRTMLHGEGR